MSNVQKELDDALLSAPVVPLIQSDDGAQSVQVMQALRRGGLRVMEVVLRTEGAYDVVRALRVAATDELVGAGTVLSVAHAHAAVAAGAQFLVSPGLDEGVVAAARELDVPILPGVATASETQRAWNLGLRQLKLFPASIAGGPGAIKALASVFRDVRFMPTGGVKPTNLVDYLSLDAVLACGGTWLTPADAIAAGQFDVIETLAREALDIAKSAR